MRKWTAFTLIEPPVVRKGKTKGFTLIELLVVIAIIVVLLAIIAPSVSTVIAMARAATCRSRLDKLGEAFGLSKSYRTTRQSGGVPEGVPSGNVRDVYPPGMLWPAIPMDAVTEPEIYQCPEEEGVAVSVSHSLSKLEYESPHGRFRLDGPGTYETMFKKRRGSCPQGTYTEYLFQDDFSAQYDQMSFNGWVDTDGGMRVYDSGIVHVWDNIELESAGSVPDWSGAHGGYPTGINTCPNTNNLLWEGMGAFNGDPKLQNHRGEDWPLSGWGSGTDYGINSLAHRHSFGNTVIVLVDYEETVVDLDTPLESEGLLVDSARHLGKVNYLKADGSVETARPQEISPLVHPKKWTR